MNGFILINKEKGKTSFDEVRRIKKLFCEKRVGHVGTLDPFADGVLIVALGRYTKLFFLFDDLDKEYVVHGVFGETRDTDDVDGKTLDIFNAADIPSKRDIENLLKEKFTGSVVQKPPIYSAKKINGKRAYDLAREGVVFDTKPVNVFIHESSVLSYEYPRFSLRLSVSKGTYIRSIVRDIGTHFSIGAYAEKLTRTRIGEVTLAETVENEEKLLSFKEMFSNIISVNIHDEKNVKMILNGDRRFFENKAIPSGVGKKYIALFGESEDILSLIDTDEKKYVYIDVR